MSTELQTTKPDRLVVHDDGPIAHLFDSARFEQMQRVAMAMARASLIPHHLCGDSADPQQRWEQTVGNCLLIVNQAVRWDMDPFAVAPETYVVRGKLGYQGKLVAAVVHGRGNLKGRLGYSFMGEGDGRTVTVAGQFKDEEEPRTITLSVGQAKTDNKMWTTDADQKLVYSGVTKWARRHCPELMLGVLTLDDLDKMKTSRLDGGEPLPLPQTKARPPGAIGDVALEDVIGPQSPPEAPTEPPAMEAASAPDEPDAPETAAESPQVTSPVTSLQLEIRYLEDINALTMIRPLNALLTDLSDDPDLEDDAVQRLVSAVEKRQQRIRSKRGHAPPAPRED
jgi:hypothetical protein